jgi:hypothetical protein
MAPANAANHVVLPVLPNVSPVVMIPREITRPGAHLLQFATWVQFWYLFHSLYRMYSISGSVQH